jgi:hypothetical protein
MKSRAKSQIVVRFFGAYNPQLGFLANRLDIRHLERYKRKRVIPSSRRGSCPV